MEITLDISQVFKLIDHAATQGARIALTEAGVRKKRIKQAEAWRRYGQSTIEKWAKYNLIKRYTDNVTRAVYFDVAELENASFINNLKK